MKPHSDTPNNSENQLLVADRKSLLKVRDRFLSINQDRLRRFYQSANHREKLFIDLLPLLLHTNHPMLPGYVSQTTPCGLSDFTPSRDQLLAAKGLSKSFSGSRQSVLKRDLLALFLMGSTGTIGQSGSSDMDIWVCHRDTLSAEELRELQQKCHAISNWAQEQGIEAHFFLMEPKQFRTGLRPAASGEDCGSTQRYLLLDEFYRTALHVAGRYPLWWMVPPQYNQQYEEYANKLIQQRFLKAEDWIDFGGLKSIPTGEFFGAALWQLYKAIDAPYKSVLKLLILEAYVARYQQRDFLSQRFKQAVYRGETDVDALDPYLMAYHLVEDYLNEEQQPERLALMRRAFYLKLKVRLSRKQKSAPEPWRYNIVALMVKLWSWDDDFIKLLDNRQQWKIEQVMQERNALMRELTHSYQLLTQFANRFPSDTKPSEADLALIGRKLYATFERKAGKVPMVNPGIAPDLQESALTFQHLSATSPNHQGWRMYRGALTDAEARLHEPLKHSEHLLELLAWAQVNGLLTRDTFVSLNAGESGMNLRELDALIRSLIHSFPAPLPGAPEEALRVPQVLQKSLVFINIGDQLSEQERSANISISVRDDALSYGSRGENLVRSLDVVLLNSWRELVVWHYRGKDALLSFITDWLKQARLQKELDLWVQCFSGHRALSITQRVNQLLLQLCERLSASPKGEMRYLLPMGNEYKLLYLQWPSPFWVSLPDEEGIRQHLERGLDKHMPLYVDVRCELHLPYKLLAEHCRSDAVTCFFHREGQQISVITVDERGVWCFHQHEGFQLENLMHAYQRFFANVAERQKHESSSRPQVMLFELKQQKKRWQLLPARVSAPRGIQLNIEALALKSSDLIAPFEFTIYCGDREFSAVQYADALYPALAEYILQQRRSGNFYPAYITDMDLSALWSPEDLSVSRYLQLKRDLENKINAYIPEH